MTFAVTCPECGSHRTQKKGLNSDTKKQRWQCLECKKITTNPQFERLKAEKVDQLTEHNMKRETKRLRAELESAYEQVQAEKERADVLGDLAQAEVIVPKWLEPSRRSRQDIAIATAFLSDTHFDEVVTPDEINWVNAYSRDIATKRVQAFFDNTLRLSFDYLSGIEMQGCVLALGGDMVSGNIHDELARTNDAGIMDTCLYWSGQLIAGIERLLTRFDRIYIPAVTGNHGRNTKKPINKGRAQDSFDWLIYKMVERHFEGDEAVAFNIPLETDARWNTYQTRYQLTHGDQFKGGNGIAGVWSPIMRGDTKKRQREQAVRTPYDILLMGHFHQLKDGGHFIMNGSLKGYDDYAAANNFGFEPPQQAFWLTDPKHGKTFTAPIRVQTEEEGWQKPSTDQIDWLKGAA